MMEKEQAEELRKKLFDEKNNGWENTSEEEKKQILVTVDFLSDTILPFNQIENVGKEILQLLEGMENELKLVSSIEIKIKRYANFTS